MIPKLLHFIWFQGFDDDKFIKKYDKLIKTWEAHNPNWRIKKWNEKSLDKFIETKYPQYLELWKSLDKIVKKCDFARYLLVYHFGGVYVDVDTECFKPLDAFFKLDKLHFRKLEGFENPSGKLLEDYEESFDPNKYKIFLSREVTFLDSKGHTVTNGILFSKPKHPFWLELIEFCAKRKDNIVLESFGTHALVRFLRNNTKKYANDVCVLPPYYFFWSKDSYKDKPFIFMFSDHKGDLNWGDFNLKHPWMV